MFFHLFNQLPSLVCHFFSHIMSYSDVFSPFFSSSNQMREPDPKWSNPPRGPCGPFTVVTGSEMQMAAASAHQTTQVPTPPTRNACMFWKVGHNTTITISHPGSRTLIRVAPLPSALPRQRIELLFDENFYIEASFECRFDHLEVRDGPFSFSPLINRFCGSTSPGLVLSSGRFMWIRFFSDDELEGMGFQVQYSFTAGDSSKYLVSMEAPECS